MRKGLHKFHKIAIFRALQLGDMLCAVPAMKAIRKAFPEAEITLIGLPWAGAFVERFNAYIDRFISFPGYPGLPEQPFREGLFTQFLSQVREEKFDLLLQMQGNGTIVNELLSGFGSRYLAGFHNADSYMDSELFVTYPEGIPEKQRHLTLIRHLGLDASDEKLEFPITEKDRKDYDNLLLHLREKKYIIVHPGSRGAWRQWPARYFAAMADYAIEDGFTVVITGTESERTITGEVIKWVRHRPLDLTGKTNLGAMGVLIQNAFALFANCTGVSHMADALQTPSLIISMDGEPERWSPANKELHLVIDWTRDPSFRNVLIQANRFLESLKKRM